MENSIKVVYLCVVNQNFMKPPHIFSIVVNFQSAKQHLSILNAYLCVFAERPQKPTSKLTQNKKKHNFGQTKLYKVISIYSNRTTNMSALRNFYSD